MFHQVFICDEPQEAAPPDELVLADVIKHDPGGDSEADMLNLKMETEDIPLGSDHVPANLNRKIKFEVKSELTDEEHLVILPDLDMAEDPKACRIKCIQEEKETADPRDGLEKNIYEKINFGETTIDFVDVEQFRNRLNYIKNVELNGRRREGGVKLPPNNVEKQIHVRETDVQYIVPDDYIIKEENRDITNISKEDNKIAEYESKSVFQIAEKTGKLEKCIVSPNAIEKKEKDAYQITSRLCLSKIEENGHSGLEEIYCIDDYLENDRGDSLSGPSWNRKYKDVSYEKTISIIPDKKSQEGLGGLLKKSEEDTESVVSLSDDSPAQSSDSCSDWEEEYIKSRMMSSSKTKRDLVTTNSKVLEQKQNTNNKSSVKENIHVENLSVHKCIPKTCISKQAVQNNFIFIQKNVDKQSLADQQGFDKNSVTIPSMQKNKCLVQNSIATPSIQNNKSSLHPESRHTNRRHFYENKITKPQVKNNNLFQNHCYGKEPSCEARKDVDKISSNKTIYRCLICNKLLKSLSAHSCSINGQRRKETYRYPIIGSVFITPTDSDNHKTSDITTKPKKIYDSTKQSISKDATQNNIKKPCRTIKYLGEVSELSTSPQNISENVVDLCSDLEEEYLCPKVDSTNLKRKHKCNRTGLISNKKQHTNEINKTVQDTKVDAQFKMKSIQRDQGKGENIEISEIVPDLNVNRTCE